MLFSVVKRPQLIGMIHLKALPGTPRARGQTVSEIIDKALEETEMLKDFDALIVENMHDLPYVQNPGPEILTTMSLACDQVRRNFPKEKPVGVQVLAGANQGALAIALAAGLDFIRAEAFVFGHVADEGWMNAQAGDLLRYRKNIGAEHVSIFSDIKKKHCAHNLTSDVTIGETASAASFFLTDGLIVTGSATGAQANPNDLEQVIKATAGKLPVLIGSGITPDNVKTFASAHGFIVGSYLKTNGVWDQDMDPARVRSMLDAINAFHP